MKKTRTIGARESSFDREKSHKIADDNNNDHDDDDDDDISMVVTIYVHLETVIMQ